MTETIREQKKSKRDNEEEKSKGNLLFLGMSYADAAWTFQNKREQIFSQNIYCSDSVFSLEAEIMRINNSLITEIDGRDLARIMATKATFGMDVFTISLENGCRYDANFHLNADFNSRKFTKKLVDKFGQKLSFNQIVLDYFWIPNGWTSSHWHSSFFSSTLPSFAADGLLRSGAAIFLPFCLTCYKEVAAAYENKLKHYYNVTFLRKDQLHKISLWVGTQQISSDLMLNIFGKRIDQEEIYCKLTPVAIQKSMEDSRISNETLLQFAKTNGLGDFEDVRFISLELI